jgi:hypothetical protein
MHVAALVGGLRQGLADSGAQAGVVVGDDELDAAPGGAALAGGEFDREDLPPAFPVDADGDVQGLAAHHAALADPLIAGVEDQVGEGLFKPARGEGGEVRRGSC